ncbi:MAG TPA: hypothetical protein VKX16_19450 [Chloroflexota bacterium]|nr:hypothetical protein [Chloroflexota bacterium]
MRRYVNCFLRNWYVILLPIIALPLAGFYYAHKHPANPTVIADLWVTKAAVQELGNGGNGPAKSLTANMEELLKTTSFDLTVAKHAPLYWKRYSKMRDPRHAIATDLSQNIKTSSSGGQNLVAVEYSTANPRVGTQVLSAFLTQAASAIQRRYIQQANTDIAYFSFELKLARTQYTAAAKNLSTYLRRHHISSRDINVTALSNPTLAALLQAVQTTRGNMTKFQTDIARVQTLRPTRPVFQIVDQPTPQSTSNRTNDIIFSGIGLAVGLLLGVGFLVIRTALDHSVRFVDEVPELLALPVLGVVPYSRALKRLAKQQRASKTRAVQPEHAAVSTVVDVETVG